MMRKMLLVLLALCLVATVAVAQTKYKESPMLTDLVKAGKLPPVDQRLPSSPKLVNEMPASQLKYEIGKYGGTLRVAALTGRDADVFVFQNEPLVNTPGLLGNEVTGNVLKSYEVSTDQKVFTFHMREGMKWSDGQPVNTEDVRYAWEDVLNNKDLTSDVPSWLKAAGNPNGEPMKLQIVDTYTFKLTSSEPYGGLLLVMALEGWKGYEELIKPAHWLKQFHKKYADPAALQKLIDADGQVKDWIQLHQKKDRPGTTDELTIGAPKLYPWLLVSATQQQKVYERNPYYFKVDSAGNQLPYIDKLVCTFVQDPEALSLKLVSGDVDYVREALALNKMPLYKQYETNGYKVGIYTSHVTPTDIFINWTYKDPIWRKVVWDLRFRQALSYAIDRKEIIDSVYFGYAQPSKIGNSEYNPAKANALLDAVGMSKRDADGFRLGPDGKPFSIDFEVSNGLWADLVPLTELVVQYWNKVGVKTTMKGVDTGLWWNDSIANNLKATVVNTQTPMWPMVPKLDWWPHWAPLWTSWWYSGGKQGEEPPTDIKNFLVKLNSIYRVPVSQAPKVGADVLKDIGDKLLYFVHIQNVGQPMIYNAKLGNIGPDPSAFAIAYNFSAEEFFFKQ